MQRLLLTTLLVALVAVSAWPQSTDAPQPASASSRPEANGSSSASPNTPWLPLGIYGELGSLGFLSEGAVNVLSGGVTLGSAYDDNTLLSNANPVGNVSYMVAPNIAIQETRPRSVWSLNYSPGFTANQRLAQRYDYAHNLNFNFQYRISERITARVQDNFVNETSVFDHLNDNPLVSAGNVLHQPNDSIITPLARRMSNLTDLDLVYQLGGSTIASASGSFNKLEFRNTAGGTNVQLFDSQSWSANAGFWHRLFGSHWLGASYAFEKIMTTGRIREGTKLHVVQLFYTFAPSQHTSFSFFVGPDHATINDQFQYVLFPFVIPVSITKEHWLVDGGMTLGWQGRRTSVLARVIHHVSDGGGLTGAVRTYNGNVDLRRQLTARLVGNIGVVYGTNDTLSHSYSNNSIRTISAVAGFERSLGNNFSVALSYARDHQNSQAAAGSSSASTLADHNRVWFSMSYHFSRPLGR